ncbi:MAG: HAD-IB family phosphatase [Clostridia bacterium]|nr:HAD-IB family phosphatase [Clostridia bacterium]
MNVYDFDGTLYDGESTFDFYLFCVKHHLKAVKFMFIVVWSFVKYKMCLVSEKQLMSLAEKYVCDFLRCCPDAKELAEKFWDKNFYKIKSFYANVHEKDDVVVSASFSFLLNPILKKIGVENSITSIVDLENTKVLQLCYRKNKVILFTERFRDAKVNNVYTDSLNDKPLMSLASGDVYIVKGKKIKKYNTEKSEIIE